MTERDGDPSPDQLFDRRMSAYLRDLQRQTFNRRGLFRMTAGAAGAAALATGARSFLPGLTVLAQDNGTINFGLDSDPRGLEPALGYDFTANIPICNITEGLMALDDKNALYPL